MAEDIGEPPDFLQAEKEPVDTDIPVKKLTQEEAYGAPVISGPLDDKPESRRKRGRPKGSKNKPKEYGSGKIGSIVSNVSKREDLDKTEEKVAERAKAILLSATGVVAVWRPHWQMTDQEAENIVRPGASWVRSKSGDDIQKVEDWLDEFDLIAVGLALLAYMIRVLREENDIRIARQRERRIEGRPAPQPTRESPNGRRFASDTQRANRPVVESVERAEETEQESGSGFSDHSSYTGGIGYSAPSAPGL